ncbi:hypothetical protein WMY93_000816 [Mugilogobius chulae]|uniref:Uncharacterized protein n=1 Tax=Mugilogobius chulae TaxID=88201 RepID=A0AAW0Q1X6_9GOBI
MRALILMIYTFLGNGSQININMSIYSHETVQTWESKASVGSISGYINKSITYVILDFHIVLHDQWAVFCYKYENETIEILPPLQTFKDYLKTIVCWLQFELRTRDEEDVKHVESELSYTEPNVDLTASYTVRIRTRINEDCLGSYQWSDWSPSVSIHPNTTQTDIYNPLNAEMILAISLGTPMILLALLLLVCQRLSKRLFPPIASPPPRYLHFLQNNDYFVSPDLAMNPDEEILWCFTLRMKRHT